MVTEPEYLYIVMMDVEPDKEELFNNTYTYEHIPHVLNVPGVLSATRYEVSTEGMPKYLAIYGAGVPGCAGQPALSKGGRSGEMAHRGETLHQEPQSPHLPPDEALAHYS